MVIRPAGSFFSIDEAMSRAKEVGTMDELKSYIREMFGDIMNLDTLQCRFYVEDDRIHWHTYLITADYADGSYKHQAVVFADSPMETLMSGKPLYEALTRNLKLAKETCEWAKDYFSAWHSSKVGLLDDAIESYADGVSRATFEKRLKENIGKISKFTTMRQLLLFISDIAEKEGF